MLLCMLVCILLSYRAPSHDCSSEGYEALRRAREGLLGPSSSAAAASGAGSSAKGKEKVEDSFDMFGDDDDDEKDGGKKDDVKVKDGQSSEEPANGVGDEKEIGGGSVEGRKVDVEMGDELGDGKAGLGEDGSKKLSMGSEYEYDPSSG